MNEANLYRYIRSRFPQGHWQRFENAVGVGQPDVNVAFNHKEYWFELKSAPHVYLQPSQFAWLHQRNSKNPNVYVWQYNPRKEEHVLWQPPFEAEALDKYLKVLKCNKKIVHQNVEEIFKLLFYLPT